MKTIASILCLILVPYLYGQEPLSKLNFAYTEGYEMRFTGQMVSYDEYNFPVTYKNSELQYIFREVDSSASETSIIIDLMQHVEDSDTLDYAGTELLLNSKGMWIIMSKASNKGKKEKHPTRAIALPLEENLVWDSYYDDKKMVSWCQSMDTIVNTPYGKMTGFAVVMNGITGNITTNLGSISIRLRTTEIYVPVLGKASIKAEVYYLSPTDGREFFLTVEELSLQSTNLSEEIIKTLPIIKE